jgi:hypothetical protein
MFGSDRYVISLGTYCEHSSLSIKKASVEAEVSMSEPCAGSQGDKAHRRDLGDKIDHRSKSDLAVTEYRVIS